MSDTLGYFADCLWLAVLSCVARSSAMPLCNNDPLAVFVTDQQNKQQSRGALTMLINLKKWLMVGG